MRNPGKSKEYQSFAKLAESFYICSTGFFKILSQCNLNEYYDKMGNNTQKINIDSFL